MAENEKKLSYNIKGKLISSIAMLLVAVIMVVSSTYAWFTLSTAPEVTSISTAVGANGALEMLLLTQDANGNWVYRSGVLDAQYDENTYWGNLVDLDGYGSNLITLYPSILNINNDGSKYGTINDTNPIKIPEYNAGGRVTTEKNAGMFGILNDRGTGFDPAGENDYGFRALGVASGLTDRQQEFRTALGAISTAQSAALNSARSSLSANGQTLANIAVKKGMRDNAQYTANELKAIENMITALDTSLKSVEDAYIQALIAYVLSSNNTAADDAARTSAGAIRDVLDDGGDVLDRLTSAINLLDGTGASAGNLPGYDTFTAAVANLNAAKTAYEGIKADVDAAADPTVEEFDWGDFSTALTKLVNIDNITINNIPVNSDDPDAVTVRTDEGKNQIAGDILGGEGVIIRIPTGGGIYADIADFCEDYTVDVSILSDSLNVGVTGVTINAKMRADSVKVIDANTIGDHKHLSTVRNAVNALPPAAPTDANQPLTEFYGYVIDLAFKTNAETSNLLLQYNAKDRIYSDNNNEETMGGGSTMTFNATATDFSTANVKNLMGLIRVVFFDTETQTILAKAQLDVATAVDGADGVTAYIRIVESVDNVWSYKANAEDPAVTVYSKEVTEGDPAVTTTKYYSDKEMTQEVTVDTVNGTLTQITEVFADQDDAIITALNQNAIKHVSVLVYLDGSTIGNEHVAATKEFSMTGKVNLQFASSANLVPMEYADLHTPDTSN